MKRIKIVFLLFFIVLVCVSSVNAEVHPPNPEIARSALEDNDCDGCPPPTPDPFPTPIDGNIVLLLVAGLLLGITVVYKNKIKKASM